MSLDTWCGSYELLSEFYSAIERRTHGRLSHLSLDVIDGAFVVEARSATYYAVQLALAAIEELTAESPKLAPAKISFLVNGHPLVLCDCPIPDVNEDLSANDESFDDVDTFDHSRHEELPSFA